MKKIRLSKSAIILIPAVLVSAILHLLFTVSVRFSDFFNSTAAAFFRVILSFITSWIPFSLAEILLYLIPVLAVLLAIYVNKKGGTVLHRIGRCFLYILSLFSIIYILFVLTFASGYRGSSFADKLNLQDRSVSATELYDTITVVIKHVNKEADEIDFSNDGSSQMPFTNKQMSSILNRSYKDVWNKYNLGTSFDSRVKNLIISPLMTYTHISGVYTFFTGEANVNTNYPDYVTLNSAAHEMAHQRGVSREDEANFAAYLICINSDNAYVRYSGYLSMYSYLSSALFSADSELYAKAVSQLSDKARRELSAFSAFFEKYRDNTASAVSDAVNDTFLKSQGTEGSVSYGMVVDLAVAYHLETSEN